MSDYAKRLAEIEARTAASTLGPWRAVEVERDGGWESALRLPSGGHVFGIPSTMVAFIAGARDDVPWLLEQLRAASEALAEAGIPADMGSPAERIALLHHDADQQTTLTARLMEEKLTASKALDKAGAALHYIGPTGAGSDETMPLADRVLDLAADRDCRVEDIALAAEALAAAGIPDDGRSLAERVKALAEMMTPKDGPATRIAMLGLDPTEEQVNAVIEQHRAAAREPCEICGRSGLMHWYHPPEAVRHIIASSRVITPPGAAIKVTEYDLTDEAKRGLTTNLDRLPPVK